MLIKVFITIFSAFFSFWAQAIVLDDWTPPAATHSAQKIETTAPEANITVLEILPKDEVDSWSSLMGLAPGLFTAVFVTGPGFLVPHFLKEIPPGGVPSSIFRQPNSNIFGDVVGNVLFFYFLDPANPNKFLLFFVGGVAGSFSLMKDVLQQRGMTHRKYQFLIIPYSIFVSFLQGNLLSDPGLLSQLLVFCTVNEVYSLGGGIALLSFRLSETFYKNETKEYEPELINSAKSARIISCGIIPIFLLLADWKQHLSGKPFAPPSMARIFQHSVAQGLMSAADGLLFLSQMGEITWHKFASVLSTRFMAGAALGGLVEPLLVFGCEYLSGSADNSHSAEIEKFVCRAGFRVLIPLIAFSSYAADSE